MLFNSHIFLLVFLPITLLGFHVLGGLMGRRSAIVWLILMSLVFYGWWNPIYLGLIAISIVGNFILGRQQCRAFDRDRHGSRPWLLVGILLNLALLGFFKYANFVQDTLNWLIGSEAGRPAFNVAQYLPHAFLDPADSTFTKILLPLAISFFTFQQIAYLADSFYGTTRNYDFVDYSLFVCFFPQLIAGPIVHHREVLPQFNTNEARLQADHLGVGATMLIYGLFKKVILADHLALCATPVFAGVEGVHAVVPGIFESWFGLICYSGQLYFDFSGYSDMAVGLSRMFGITLPMNFNAPLKARSIIEFWQRWHITLSRFLRDYLFFWLCGKRPTAVRLYASLFVTMVLGGLWHGAGWTFVLWGALHGAYLLVNHGWRKLTAWRGWTAPGRVMTGGYVLLTYLCFILSLVLFRAGTFGGALRIFRGLFAGAAQLPRSWGQILTRSGWATLPQSKAPITWAGFTFDDMGALPSKGITWAVVTLLIVWVMPTSNELLFRTKPVLQRLTPPVGWRRLLAWDRTWYHALITVGLFVWCLLSLTNVSEFIYWQF